MPSNANSQNLKTLLAAFRQAPIPGVTLVDLKHRLDGSIWPTVCILEPRKGGDKLYPHAFMIDRGQHGLCRQLLVPKPYRDIWDWCIPGYKPETPV